MLAGPRGVSRKTNRPETRRAAHLEEILKASLRQRAGVAEERRLDAPRRKAARFLRVTWVSSRIAPLFQKPGVSPRWSQSVAFPPASPGRGAQAGSPSPR